MRTSVLCAAVTLVLGIYGCPGSAPPDAGVLGPGDGGTGVGFDGATTAPSDAAAVTGDGSAQAAPIDAGPRLPEQLPLTIRATFGDAGIDLAGDAGVIPVGSGFVVRVPFAAPMLRVRLEAAGHAVESRGRLEVRSSETVYRLQPEEPLEPGVSYVVDVGPNAAARDLADGTGRVFSDARVAVTAAGERVKTPPKKRPKRRR